MNVNEREAVLAEQRSIAGHGIVVKRHPVHRAGDPGIACGMRCKLRQAFRILSVCGLFLGYRDYAVLGGRVLGLELERLVGDVVSLVHR